MGDGEAPLGEGVGDVEAEGEGVERAGGGVVGEGQAAAGGLGLGPGEQAVAGEAVLGQAGGGAGVVQGVVSQAADDGEQHGRVARPWRGGGPEEVLAVGLELAEFGAEGFDAGGEAEGGDRAVVQSLPPN